MSEQSSSGDISSSESEGSPSSEHSKEVYTSMDRTSVGNPPKDWDTRRLGEISGDTLYGASKSAEGFDPEKPRYLRVTDLSEDRNDLKDKEPKSISRDKVEKYILEKGDMLFARSGSVGKTFYYDGSDDEYAYGGYLIRFPLQNDEVNPYYLQSYTHSPLYWNWVERITRTGAQPNINAREYSSLLIPIPPISEQRRIASVLYNVDGAIRKTEEIIEQTQRVKEGLMQDLFTEGYHDHGKYQDRDLWINMCSKAPDNWDIVKAEKTMTIRRGASPRPKSDSSLFGGKIPWIKIGDVEREKSHYVTETEDTVTEKGKNKSEFVEEGTLLVANSGATCGFSILAGKNGCVHDGWLILEDYNSFHKKYLLHFINWHQDFLQSLAPGSAQTNLNTNRFGLFDIPRPPKDEQKKIAEVLDKLDEALFKNRKLISRLQRLKKGLMQDLLTGEVRTDESVEVLDEIVEVEG